MAEQSNVAPIIIKRKKVIVGGGHHGGAWKVAYADFVTAMMAFFMLMWLLNATTEKQRKGIADYFNPTIPLSRVSGGGDGAFGGDSTFSEERMAQSGTGEPNGDPDADTDAQADSSAETAAKNAAEQRALEELAENLKAKGGESMTMERLMRHVVTRVSDEGLIIEIFDLPDAALFIGETAEATADTQKILALIADVVILASNWIAVNGYVKSYPITLIEDPTWDLTTARAQAVRIQLEALGLIGKRIARVAGHADRKPITADPTAVRNNRIEVILLRRDR